MGTQLLSQAILEHRPPFKILNLMIALESMLLERRTESQGFRLARRSAYFACGAHDNSLCGRDRESCVSLTSDPGNRRARDTLGRVRVLADLDLRWRCSEWLRYLRWYDLRSAVAHGDASEGVAEAAREAEYWLLRWTVEPVLSWLAEHPDQPLQALDDALAALPSPPGWQADVPDPETYDADAFHIPGGESV